MAAIAAAEFWVGRGLRRRKIFVTQRIAIAIVFDEGDDTGPDNFGLAVVDTINVNGTRVGRGP